MIHYVIAFLLRKRVRIMVADLRIIQTYVENFRQCPEHGVTVWNLVQHLHPLDYFHLLKMDIVPVAVRLMSVMQSLPQKVKTSTFYIPITLTVWSGCEICFM